MKAGRRVQVITTPQCPWNPWFAAEVRRLAGDQTVEEIDCWRSPAIARPLLSGTGAGHDSHLFCRVVVDGRPLRRHPGQPDFAEELLRVLGKSPGKSAGAPVRPAGDVRPGDGPLAIRPLDEGSMDQGFELCLRYHPSGLVVPEGPANAGRRAKEAYLREVLAVLSPAGYLAVDTVTGRPAGLLELAPRAMAARCGFITGGWGGEEPVVTVTCLEVARGWDRPAVQAALVGHLAASRDIFRPCAAIEVGAFPGEDSFPPAGVFLRAGFVPVEERVRAVVLKLEIPH